MTKKIVFVGWAPVEGEQVISLDFRSDSSLLDGDIIVFSIDTTKHTAYARERFQGLTCLEDNESFRLRSDCTHWSGELRAALTDGKTVIVFLTDSPLLCIATGKVNYSGTGRNARRERIVETFDPYTAIPYTFGSVVRRSGERIKPVSDLGILATYWHQFGEYTKYEAYIDGFKGTPLLCTQTGEKVIGGIARFTSAKGALILLPPPHLSAMIDARIEVLKSRRKKTPGKDVNKSEKAQNVYRRRVGRSIAAEFLAAIASLDKAVRSALDLTPPPAWSDQERYSLTREKNLQVEITETLAKINELDERQKTLMNALKGAQQLRALLYEKGKPLERAILAALRLLGFKAENFKEGDSEFDAVMVDPGGLRLIGEAEGKDDKAINIDKMDQLERNIREDFARQTEGTSQFAQGVLFGNAYRLTQPDQRQEFFTEKCRLSAKRSRISLVRTTNLFIVVQYLERSPDDQFAAACRRAIAHADGEIVSFPELPS